MMNRAITKVIANKFKRFLSFSTHSRRGIKDVEFLLAFNSSKSGIDLHIKTGKRGFNGWPDSWGAKDVSLTKRIISPPIKIIMYRTISSPENSFPDLEM